MAYTRHGADLVQVTRLRFVNAYLVLEDDGATVVDTTLRGGAQAIIDAAGAFGVPVRRFAVTHGHGDHVGSLDALVERLPDADVVLAAREARLMAGDLSLDPDEPRGFGTGGPLARIAYPRVEARPARTLAPGDRLGSLEVVAAPGHTPGQVAFLDTRDGTLLCADAYATLTTPVTSARPTLRSPVPALFTWLRALDPVRLAPGHGRVVVRPAEVMDRALATAS
jgi:glyoxylase-like metal-dependent hydrolase (beta-lactamase superfamily II)